MLNGKKRTIKIIEQGNRAVRQENIIALILKLWYNTMVAYLLIIRWRKYELR